MKHFDNAKQALAAAKRTGQRIRCHVCCKAASWPDVSVEDIGHKQWHCLCSLCESGVSSNELLQGSSVGPLSCEAKPMKAMKVKVEKAMKLKVEKAMKVKVEKAKVEKAMKAMKAMKSRN